MQTKLYVQRLDPRVPLPAYQTAGSAAFDLAALLDEPLVLSPGTSAVIPTGLAIALPVPGWVALVAARSGLGIRHGITLSNGVGVIDSDYRGEIRVGLTNLSQIPYTIQPGDRIAQRMVIPVAQAEIVELEALPATRRGTGGLGSTGR